MHQVHLTSPLIKQYKILNIIIVVIEMSQLKVVGKGLLKNVASKPQVTTQLQQKVSQQLEEIFSHLDAENKRLSSFVSVSKASQITYGKDKHVILIHIAYRGQKVLPTPLYKKIVVELEIRLKKTVLLLATRTIESLWVKKNRTQKRPNSRTLTAVYAAILDELLLPSIILGARTRVRLDGSSFTKITVDKADQPFLEDRVDAIKAVYKRLTTRDIVIDFQKDNAFYTLKKADKK